MSFYLRVESVNLSYFIDDTNDLSTTRGGSLLLLEALEEVEEIVAKYIPKKEKLGDAEIAQLVKKLNILNNSKRTRAKKKDIKTLTDEIEIAKKGDSTPTITKGASWGLFSLETSHELACSIKTDVINRFNTHSEYQYATLVVDLYEINNQFQKDRDSVQALNHWQQMQSPSIAISKQGTTSCALDKVRPATEQRYLKDGTQDFVSDSVYQRQKYGRDPKNEFYQKITCAAKEFTKEKMENAKFTHDLGELSKCPDKGILNGKIAYIYIDGNGFGDIQKSSKTANAQKTFDQNSRTGRETMFTDILKQIVDDENWQFKETAESQSKIRLETLLWGGDEIIWVVPAWQGWWMVNEFYRLAKKHITNNGTELFHATGLVFCHHNAPLHRVKTLASDLAELGKDACRQKNYIAYQVLESFDHVGMQLKPYRGNRINNLGTWKDLLIDAKDINAIQTEVLALKGEFQKENEAVHPAEINNEFAQRKIYQILRAYKHGDIEKAEQYIKKLSTSSLDSINILRLLLGEGNAHWLHLVDLWNYTDHKLLMDQE